MSHQYGAARENVTEVQGDHPLETMNERTECKKAAEIIQSGATWSTKQVINQ